MSWALGLSACMSVLMYICLSGRKFACKSVCPPCLPACLSVCVSARLPACLSVCASARLPDCLSVVIINSARTWLPTILHNFPSNVGLGRTQRGVRCAHAGSAADRSSVTRLYTLCAHSPARACSSVPRTGRLNYIIDLWCACLVLSGGVGRSVWHRLTSFRLCSLVLLLLYVSCSSVGPFVFHYLLF